MVAESEQWPVIKWTPAKLRELKRLYRACTAETFQFEGHTILKAYAKYLIQYLEGLFGKGAK